jgi:hypothetical protein
MGRAALSFVCMLLACLPATPPAPQPVASLWYRGTPPGTPRADDLAAIRAIGFTSVTWPQSYTQGAAELRRLTDIVGLEVVIRIEPALITARAALQPGEAVDVPVSAATAGTIAAVTWRAIAHGARVVSFDPGPVHGSGLGAGAEMPAWVEPARTIARQLEFNGRMLAGMRSGGSIRIAGADAASLDVVLLQDAQSWLAIATNTSTTPVRAVVRMPSQVPPALWSNLIEGGHLSMLAQPDGPRWTLSLDPGGVKVIVISKTGGDANRHEAVKS